MNRPLLALLALLAACNPAGAPEPPPAPTASQAPPAPSTGPSVTPVAELRPVPVLSSYSTPLDPKQAPERLHNVKLAAKALDWATMPPDSALSFNETVGPRTETRGYLAAPQYFAQTKVEGVGGGVCQVSSTLYVAAMQGGLIAARRYAHSRPVSYTPPGTDAAVVDGELDLVIANPYDAILTLRTKVEDGKLTITFKGLKPQFEVERIDRGSAPNVEPPVQKITSPFIEAPRKVQNGKPGFSYTTIWNYRRNGEVFDKQVVLSRYKPVPELWVIPKEP